MGLLALSVTLGGREVLEEHKIRRSNSSLPLCWALLGSGNPTLGFQFSLQTEHVSVREWGEVEWEGTNTAQMAGNTFIYRLCKLLADVLV